MQKKKLFGAWIAAAVLVLAVAGCKSSPEGAQIPPTPSGFPEVEVQGKTRKDIDSTIREFFKGHGYIERNSRHADEMVFDKPAKAGKPEALRVDLRLERQPGNAWKIIGIPLRVEDWQTNLESTVGVPQGKAQILAFLNEIKARIEATH